MGPPRTEMCCNHSRICTLQLLGVSHTPSLWSPAPGPKRGSVIITSFIQQTWTEYPLEEEFKLIKARLI